jgi:hypothetical protein
MKMDAKLLPLVQVGDAEFLVDIENREFRDFDDSKNVIKMHSPAGRGLLEQMKGSDWDSMGISTGRKELEI